MTFAEVRNDLDWETFGFAVHAVLCSTGGDEGEAEVHSRGPARSGRTCEAVPCPREEPTRDRSQSS